MMGDLLGYLGKLARKYGDIVGTGFLNNRIVLLNHPDYVQDVLVTHVRKFRKADARLHAIMGNGLLTSEGDFHLRQRRMMQPAFHRDRIAAYASVVAAQTQRLQEQWKPGAIVEMTRAMMWLTQVVVAECLFRADVTAQAGEVTAALTEVLQSGRIVTRLPFRRLLEHLRLPGLRRFHRALGRLDAVVYQIIKDHRAAGDQGTLLSTLLAARDSEGDGTGMSDQQVRDELITIFLAGHETTANALTWTWYLLAQNPGVEAKLHVELDSILGGQPPTVHDLPRLPYTELVLREAMRLYPPVPLLVRRSVEEYFVAGYTLPANTLIMFSAWLIQRDARFYPEPERFNPDRWTPEFRASLPHFAYFPFGGGPRLCIGEPFAWMEGTLILAALAQKWRFRLAPGHPPVVGKLSTTLRPSPEVRMVVQARGGAAR
jgi:cytochrome P450